MRLDKYLADAGLGTRKEVQKLIAAGRVRIDGRPVKNGGEQVTGAVTYDGAPVAYVPALYAMMNKPEGVLTAARDRSAPTVEDFFPPLYLRRGVHPVGRLDKDVGGLLFLTDDGALNHRLTSPRYGVEKVYLARVDGVLNRSDVEAFARGLALADFTALPAKLEILEPDLGRVTVCEGKFHQVKRMFQRVEKPVLCLRRIQMGGVFLDEALKPGEIRELSFDEIESLRRAAGMDG